MNTIIFNEPECPRCGCRDLREKHWGWVCFKCDHYMPRGQVEFIKYDGSELSVDNPKPKMINVCSLRTPDDIFLNPLEKDRKD